MSAEFSSIAVIGIGLIGSSIAHGLKAKNICADVRLFDQSAEVRLEAGTCVPGLIADTIEQAVTGADLVILCVPVGAMGAVGAQMAPFLKNGAVVSDVGSVKQAVISQLAENLPAHTNLIAAHPIAGTEYSGPRAGFSSLFEGRWCIITPQEADETAAYQAKVADVVALWKALGSQVDVMDAGRHDAILAVTSHLPHLIAFTIVTMAEDIEDITESDVVKYSAGGFRDFTRIAASDPTMWRDVFLLNKDAILDLLGRFSEDLTALRRAIRWDDGEALFNTITRARRMRRDVIDAGQDTSQPNFGRNIP